MRKLYHFPGGIHLTANKQQSLRTPIISAGIPDLLILPLTQTTSAPARPVVSVGDQVLKGQLIAAAQGLVSVPVHAPTSGEITAIGPQPLPHPSNLAGTCISLRPDGADQWIARPPLVDFRQLDKPALLAAIVDAGIVGMGGAGFPTALKLAGKPGAGIHTLIINGTECEPYITADDILMRERPADIVTGIQIVQQLLQPATTLVAIEDNKPEAIAAMRAAVAGTSIEIVVIPGKYPSGGEKQLIQILTGREVPSGGLPADLGMVVQNPGTALAIRNALVLGEPLLSRITTVTGNAVTTPRNYEVLLGTPVQHLLDLSGYRPGQGTRLIMGGPMLGFTLTNSKVPVIKTTNCILAPDGKEAPEPALQQACIRCGSCAAVCPASLLPQQLFWFSQGNELEKLAAHHLEDCIECGCCSYVCPSNIPLVQYYRASKAAMQQMQVDRANAAQFKTRFEARQARIDQEHGDKETRRAARQQAAAAKAQALQSSKPDAPAATQIDKAAVIQAAIARSAAKKAALGDPLQAALKPAKTTREADN